MVTNQQHFKSLLCRTTSRRNLSYGEVNFSKVFSKASRERIFSRNCSTLGIHLLCFYHSSTLSVGRVEPPLHLHILHTHSAFQKPTLDVPTLKTKFDSLATDFTLLPTKDSAKELHQFSVTTTYSCGALILYLVDNHPRFSLPIMSGSSSFTFGIRNYFTFTFGFQVGKPPHNPTIAIPEAKVTLKDNPDKVCLDREMLQSKDQPAFYVSYPKPT